MQLLRLAYSAVVVEEKSVKGRAMMMMVDAVSAAGLSPAAACAVSQV